MFFPPSVFFDMHQLGGRQTDPPSSDTANTDNTANSAARGEEPMDISSTPVADSSNQQGIHRETTNVTAKPSTSAGLSTSTLPTSSATSSASNSASTPGNSRVTNPPSLVQRILAHMSQMSGAHFNSMTAPPANNSEAINTTFSSTNQSGSILHPNSNTQQHGTFGVNEGVAFRPHTQGIHIRSGSRRLFSQRPRSASPNRNMPNFHNAANPMSNLHDNLQPQTNSAWAIRRRRVALRRVGTTPILWNQTPREVRKFAPTL